MFRDLSTLEGGGELGFLIKENVLGVPSSNFIKSFYGA